MRRRRPPLSTSQRVARFVLGYRPDAAWPTRWRLVPPAALAAALIVAFAVTLRFAMTDPIPTHGNVRVTARLDEFTRSRDPKTMNSIPEFLRLPGTLGAIVVEPPLDTDAEDALLHSRAVQAVNETELSKGFCTPTLALLIRQRFPGVYDELADEELEQRALARYPEYRDRLCVLPAWIGASPHQIVKYELEPIAVATSYVAGLVWGAVLTALFGFTTVNLYYRLVLPFVGSSSI